MITENQNDCLTKLFQQEGIPFEMDKANQSLIHFQPLPSPIGPLPCYAQVTGDVFTCMTLVACEIPTHLLPVLVHVASRCNYETMTSGCVEVSADGVLRIRNSCFLLGDTDDVRTHVFRTIEENWRLCQEVLPQVILSAQYLAYAVSAQQPEHEQFLRPEQLN